MSLIYMAHPVAADSPTDVRANLANARRWLAWLKTALPQDTVIAPWIVDVEIAMDAHGTESTGRARGLADCLAVVKRCDRLALTGGRISEGMRIELEHHGQPPIDLTWIGYDAPKGRRDRDCACGRWIIRGGSRGPSPSACRVCKAGA